MHWVDKMCIDFNTSINEIARGTGLSTGIFSGAKRRNTPIRKMGYDTIDRIAAFLKVYKETLITMYDEE